ncbi:MAG: type 1 glutamine amidotransferase [Pseudomonadota bacterium]
MRLGILQTGHVPEDLAADHGAYPKMFENFLSGNGFTFDTYSVVDSVFPEGPFSAEGWLITGSRHGAYEDHSWIPPLETLIREIYAAEVPLVGICFGHQIMAQALGGKVEKFGGLWGVGNKQYTHTDGSTSTLLAMHQDQVVVKPPEAIVTATAQYCENAAFTYKGRAMSIQPHPEFTPEFMAELIKQRSGSVIPEDQASPGLASLTDTNDAPKFAREIAEFFKKAIAERAA